MKRLVQNYEKRLLHKIVRWLYELGYSVWFMLGRKLYYIDMYDVRQYDENTPTTDRWVWETDEDGNYINETK